MNYKGNSISNGLIDSRPLLILPELAEAIGLNQAIFIQQLHFLLNIKQENYRVEDIKQGKLWVYNSIADWRDKYFRFFSESTLKRAINDLVLEGYVIKGNFNIDKRDQRLWYTINYEKLEQKVTDYKNELREQAIKNAIERSKKEP